MLAHENPFRTKAVHGLSYRFSGRMEMDVLMSRFRDMRRAAIVGPKGRGKTTLLSQCIHWLHARGTKTQSVRLSSENRAFAPRRLADLATASAETVLLVDGAEEANWYHWRRFRQQTKGHAGLLITTHRPGRLPTLCECETTESMFVCLVRELAPGLADAGTLKKLFARHRGNVRLCFRELYDACAERTA